MNKIDTVIGLCLISMSMQAQAIKWFNPQQSEIPCIQQRGWADEMKNSYARLPDRARAEVREPVWKLSRNAAGLAIYGEWWTEHAAYAVDRCLRSGFVLRRQTGTLDG